MRISEVIKRFDLTADTLRYNERVGLIPPVNRTESGIRDYTQPDLEWVDLVKYMRSAGMLIEVLAECVDLVQQGDHVHQARKKILVEQRDKLIRKIDELQ